MSRKLVHLLVASSTWCVQGSLPLGILTHVYAAVTCTRSSDACSRMFVLQLLSANVVLRHAWTRGTGSEIKGTVWKRSWMTRLLEGSFALRSFRLNTDWCNSWFSCKNHMDKRRQEHLHRQTGNVCIIINPPPTKDTPQTFIYSYVKWRYSVIMFRLITTVLVDLRLNEKTKQIYSNSFLAEQKTPLANNTCTNRGHGGCSSNKCTWIIW